MPREMINADTIERAVENIVHYLEDTSSTAHKAIYFDGTGGLAASAVLTAIAENPPPSLLKKFDKIIHIDCSRWKSRRALQKTIAQELKLPRRVMDIFDRQDEEDDFRGVVESSRAEIQYVGAEIHRATREHKCLVLFHNGSDNTIDLDDFGILLSARFGTRVLWTFRGRLRLIPRITEKVDDSHLFLYDIYSLQVWNYLLQIEAGEIAGYTDKLGEAATECCLYLLSLNSQGGNIMDYDWATHASNYWVCDGIIQGGQDDKAWEVAAALHQHVNTEDYSSNVLPSFGHKLRTPLKQWILSKDSSLVHPESTSFFLASEADPLLRRLPNDMFHQSDKLCVLKLCHCTFSFSSPPFRRCHKLRFLGLDSCQDLRPEEDEKQDMDFLKSLWVIDIHNTDWHLPSSPEIIEHMATNIREVHIKNGRFWHIIFASGQPQNLHKLRVIDPTCCSLETGGKDEFTFLPSLSTSTSLKTLVLDGCVGLEHVEGLPPSLESFSLDARPRKDDYREAKISRISLAGCARLSEFTLRGSLPHLQKLDLSGTRVKTLDLTTRVVQTPSLKQIILLGCMQLLSILWPETGMPKHTVLHIDSSVCHVQAEPHQAYATIMDIRFLQTLVLESNVDFCWKSTRSHLKLCVPACSNKVEEQSNKEKTAMCSSGQIMGPPRPKSLIPNAYITYMDVVADIMTVDDGYNSASQFQPLGSHVEIGDGISFTGMESTRAMKATIFVMNKAKSLHAHDNSSVTTVIPDHMMSVGGEQLLWRNLESCHVVRCPKMLAVFITNYHGWPFTEIETFWADDLPMAHCIWSKRNSYSGTETTCFAKLRSIHLYSCPRLAFVLPLLWESVLEFPSLKHIHLYELYKLQHICEVKMHAPKLERVWLRGCWSLRRLPAIGGARRRPVVDCEQDWWENLEWDGLEAGHDPCLFERRHSSHYKKPLPRVSVLR